MPISISLSDKVIMISQNIVVDHWSALDIQMEILGTYLYHMLILPSPTTYASVYICSYASLSV